MTGCQNIKRWQSWENQERFVVHETLVQGRPFCPFWRSAFTAALDICAAERVALRRDAALSYFSRTEMVSLAALFPLSLKEFTAINFLTSL